MNYTPPDFTYMDRFTCWQDVKDAFLAPEPEPAEVLLAYHGAEFGVGEAHVFYVKGKHFYVVSEMYPVDDTCGLEGLWFPKKYTRQGLLNRNAAIAEDLSESGHGDLTEHDLVLAVNRRVATRNELA